MQWYVDTSVVLHATLPWGDSRAAAWLDRVRAEGDAVFSSALLELELVRALRQAGQTVEIVDCGGGLGIGGRHEELPYSPDGRFVVSPRPVGTQFVVTLHGPRHRRRRTPERA